MLSTLDLCLDFKTGIKKVDICSTSSHKFAWFRNVEAISLFKDMLDEWLNNNRKISDKSYQTQVQRIALSYGVKSNVISSTYGSTAKKKIKKRKQTPNKKLKTNETETNIHHNESHKSRSIGRSR